MSMLSSCRTISSRAPLPGKFSSASAATLVSLPRVPVSRRKVTRAPLLVCHAQFNIQPNALVDRNPTMTHHEQGWNILEDKDIIILKIKVGESTSRKKVKVQVQDQSLLVIRNEDEPDSKAVKLVMPTGYESNRVTASTAAEFLLINIPKPKPGTAEVQVLDAGVSK